MIPENYESLGWYAPFEARKLLEALETVGIGAHTGDGGREGVLIAVESARRPEADSIHGEIFGTGLAGLTDKDALSGNWVDPDGTGEVKLLGRRAVWVHELRDVDDELNNLLDEVAAVDDELREGTQSPVRLEALRKARDRHSVNHERLLAAKQRLTEELRNVDKLLYDSQQTRGLTENNTAEHSPSCPAFIPIASNPVSPFAPAGGEVPSVTVNDNRTSGPAMVMLLLLGCVVAAVGGAILALLGASIMGMHDDAWGLSSLGFLFQGFVVGGSAFLVLVTILRAGYRMKLDRCMPISVIVAVMVAFVSGVACCFIR